MKVSFIISGKLYLKGAPFFGFLVFTNLIIPKAGALFVFLATDFTFIMQEV